METKKDPLLSEASGKPKPSESTPLVPGKDLEAGATGGAVEEMANTAKENKAAMSGAYQAILGLFWAVVCLIIFYTNGGDDARCLSDDGTASKLPLFLKVKGFGSLVYALAGFTLGVAAARIKSEGTMLQLIHLASCSVGCLGCFLFVWLICGIVWFIGTDEAACKGMYQGTEVFFIFYLLVPLVLCCCCCCCLIGMKKHSDRMKQKQSDDAPVAAAGGKPE